MSLSKLVESDAPEDVARHGLLHGDVMTCTGKTMAENLARLTISRVPRHCSCLENPVKETATCAFLR